MVNLSDRVAAFAEELQRTLEGVLPGQFRITSIQAEDSQRFILRVADKTAPKRARIPLFVDGEPLADLSITQHLSLDRTDTHLKTVKSDLRVFSRLERTPLLRLEYQHDMRSAPIAHWQMHAERGAFSHLLARANHHRSANARKPNALSSYTCQSVENDSGHASKMYCSFSSQTAGWTASPAGNVLSSAAARHGVDVNSPPQFGTLPQKPLVSCKIWAGMSARHPLT